MLELECEENGVACWIFEWAPPELDGVDEL